MDTVRVTVNSESDARTVARTLDQVGFIWYQPFPDTFVVRPARVNEVREAIERAGIRAHVVALPISAVPDWAWKA